MNKKGIYTAVLVSALLVPVISFAAFANLQTMLCDIKKLLGTVYTMTFGLAMLFFMWNMGQVILKSGDPKAKEEARNKMIWGIVAIFIMLSIYGIVEWIGLALDVPQDAGSGTTTSGCTTTAASGGSGGGLFA